MSRQLLGNTGPGSAFVEVAFLLFAERDLQEAYNWLKGMNRAETQAFI
jgi:hypothetical protein